MACTSSLGLAILQCGWLAVQNNVSSTVSGRPKPSAIIITLYQTVNSVQDKKTRMYVHIVLRA